METLEQIEKQFSKITPLKKITTINVESIPCYCSIGIDSEEKNLGQKLIIDASVDIDSSSAVNSDNVTDTLSYVDIYKVVQEVGSSKPHSLIETLAEEIADVFLVNPIVSKVKIKIHKPHIPYPDFQGNVSVEVTREK